jgi:hypothetical protein
MKKVLVASVMFFALAGTQVFAVDNIGPGLGRVLLKGKSGKVMELLGTCLNGISGNGTFAITSGTSGYQEGAAIGNNSVELYVAENMDSIANDIAKGNGEYLDTLAQLMKVENKNTFKDSLHKNFNKIYTSKDVTSKEVVANIKAINS